MANPLSSPGLSVRMPKSQLAVAFFVLGSLLLLLRRRARTRNLPPAAPVAPFDAAAGGFPVPPIPKQGTNIASRHAGARSTVAASQKENADA